jgi:hypothetical protein
MNKIFFEDFIAVEGFSVHLIMKAIILLIQQQSSACSFPVTRNDEQTIKFLKTFLIHYFNWKSRLTALFTNSQLLLSFFNLVSKSNKSLHFFSFVFFLQYYYYYRNADQTETKVFCVPQNIYLNECNIRLYLGSQ